MSIPEVALSLAGFVLAHAAWSVSDLPEGELLVPLAIIEKYGKRQLIRFEAETQEEAIKKGKSALTEAKETADAWAFAREGLLTEGNGKVEVLAVDFWAKGMKEPVTLFQRFEPYATKGEFKIIGNPELIIDDMIQPSDKMKELLEFINKGINQHPKVSSLWESWQTN